MRAPKGGTDSRRNTPRARRSPYGTGDRRARTDGPQEVSMRHRGSDSSSVLALAAMVAALLVWPAAGEAQLGGILPPGILPATTTVLSGTRTRRSASPAACW